MPLQFVLDENMRGRLWQAIRQHNGQNPLSLDVVRVGDVDDLPLQSTDEEILAWCERENRILVTNDHRTIPPMLKARLESGHHSPGVFLVRRGTSVMELLEFLIVAAHASEPHEWLDRIEYTG